MSLNNVLKVSLNAFVHNNLDNSTALPHIIILSRNASGNINCVVAFNAPLKRISFYYLC